jgi:hypothetical protein
MNVFLDSLNSETMTFRRDVIRTTKEYRETEEKFKGLEGKARVTVLKKKLPEKEKEATEAGTGDVSSICSRTGSRASRPATSQSIRRVRAPCHVMQFNNEQFSAFRVNRRDPDDWKKLSNSGLRRARMMPPPVPVEDPEPDNEPDIGE